VAIFLKKCVLSRTMEKKREILLIILLLIISFGMRVISINNELSGADAYYHYSVLEQNIAQGRLDNINSLDLCYGGHKGNHPIGFYAIPYFLSGFIGLSMAFLLTPVIVGVVSILLTYYLLSLIFGKRTAIISSFLIAVSIAHIFRSAATMYRGDNLVYPFILLSLIFLLKFLIEKDFKKKIAYSTAAGLISGLSAIMWNGYMVAIVVFVACLGFYMLYEYLKKQDIRQNVFFSFIAVLTQFIVLKLTVKLFVFKEGGKAIEFANNYYLQYIIIPLVLFLISLEAYNVLIKKYKKNKFLKLKYSRFVPLITLLVIGAIVVSLKSSSLINVLTGFGSLIPGTSIAQATDEIQATRFVTIWSDYWILSLFSVAGLFFLFKQFDSKKSFFLGFLIPLVYMGLLSKRYSFLMSIPFIALSGVFLNLFVDKYKKIQWKYIIGIVIVVLGFYSAGKVGVYLRTVTDESMTESLQYFGDNTDEDSCLITLWTYGSHVQYFAKRHSYTSSVSLDLGRIKGAYTFLLTEEEPDFEQENLYIYTSETYLGYLRSMNKIAGISGIDISPKKGYSCPYNSIKWGLLWLSDNLCKSNMIKMLKGEEIRGLEKVYDKDRNFIYKIAS
jgi:dolichyl-diphosphooligosaccharide--protein glycosyltransferase